MYLPDFHVVISNILPLPKKVGQDAKESLVSSSNEQKISECELVEEGEIKLILSRFEIALISKQTNEVVRFIS